MILKINKRQNTESGLSLLEALVAVVIFILGLAGIYMMSTLANRSMISSIERDKLNMVSSMVLENISTDVDNILKYHEENCYETPSGSSLKDEHLKRWSKKYKRTIGTRDASGNIISSDKEGQEDCRVEVEDITGDKTQFMIKIIITKKNGKKIQISKRINK